MEQAQKQGNQQEAITTKEVRDDVGIKDYYPKTQYSEESIFYTITDQLGSRSLKWDNLRRF